MSNPVLSEPIQRVLPAIVEPVSIALQDLAAAPAELQYPDQVRIVPTGGALGAFVDGIDAGKPLSGSLAHRLRQALAEHRILVYRGQKLTDPAFLAFATHFGGVFRPPQDVPVLASSPAGIAPDVVPVANVEGGYTGNGELTPHSDHQWAPLPSKASLLYAVEVPRAGGETSWFDLVAAYDDLDEATKARIEHLQLITYNPFLRQPGEPRHRYRTPDREPLGPAFPHPLVVTHPVNGRKLLYLSTHTEVELVGVDAVEGEALVARLRAHIDQAKFRYTHKWTPGDIVHWDNIATLHSRTAFDPSERRVLRRVSLAGGRLS